MKNLLLIFVFNLIFILPGNTQITFHTNYMQDNFLDVTGMDYENIKDFGIKVPINDALRKYDKIKVVIVSKLDGKEYEANKKYFEFYPTERGFKDRYESAKNINIYLIQKVHDVNPNVIENKGYVLACEKWKYSTNYTYKFKVQVWGYFTDGEEKYWSDRKKAYVTRPLYTFSKSFVESKEFTFLKNDKKVKMAADRVLSLGNLGKIRRAFKNTPLQPIYDAYYIFREYYVEEKKDYNPVLKVESKLIELLNSNPKKLRKLIIGQTDPVKIMQIILDY